MTRKLPLIPTIVVAGAVAVMIGLGVWQLQRAQWKEGLLRQYAEAEKLPPIAFPTLPLTDDATCRCSAMRPACACGRSDGAPSRAKAHRESRASSISSTARPAPKARG